MKAIPFEEKRGVQEAVFPRHYRLTKTGEFSSVFSFRRAFKSTGFLLHYYPQGETQTKGARLGLVIAKRFLRRSVDRNLFRRLIREAFRQQRYTLPSCDLIFRLAGKPAFPLDRRAISEEIQNLLDRLRAIKY